jgi:glutathione S-transferase
MITLYAEQLWDSPFVFTVFVALEEKRAPYRVTVLDLAAGDQRRPKFLEGSLTARVPAIEHDGFWLSESSAIVEYLEETFAPPDHVALLPEERNGRARARQIMAWLRTDLHALRRDRPTEAMFYERAKDPLSPSGRADADKLVRVAQSLLQGDRSSIFERFSIADADLAFMLARLRLNGDTLPEAVSRYVDGVWRRPSVQGYVNQPRPKSPH